MDRSTITWGGKEFDTEAILSSLVDEASPTKRQNKEKKAKLARNSTYCSLQDTKTNKTACRLLVDNLLITNAI